MLNITKKRKNRFFLKELNPKKLLNVEIFVIIKSQVVRIEIALNETIMAQKNNLIHEKYYISLGLTEYFL